MTKAFEASSSSSSTSSPANNDVTLTSKSSSPPCRQRQQASCTASSSPPLTINEAGGGNSIAEEKSVTNLDDEGLRALLDEAINYKRPKDREGKSKLFNSLLSDAEDEIRKKHAYNASGPARHFSTTAKKRHRHRHRQPSSGVADTLSHAGSLNDLGKQELYDAGKMMQRATTSKTVSERQREGGSLPCNVNATIDKQFFVDERQQPAQQQQQHRIEWANANDETTITASRDDDDDVEECSDTTTSSATTRLRIPQAFSNRATPTMASKVDDGVIFPQIRAQPIYELDGAVVRHVSPAGNGRSLLNRTVDHLVRHEKKLDENGNALAASAVSLIARSSEQSATSSAFDAKKQKKRKKKQQHDEDVVIAYQIEGHRADIIDDIDSLVSYIDGTEEKAKPRKKQQQGSSSSPVNIDVDGKSKRRARKGGKATSMLMKASSLEEISASKLTDELFTHHHHHHHHRAFDAEKVPLRPTKSNAECAKTWTASSEQLATTTTTTENVEIADFIFVTKKKKKSKKRRNSLGSRATNGSRTTMQQRDQRRPAEFHGLSLRARSPRRREAISDKSAESSDNENASVKSMPTQGTLVAQVAVADDYKMQTISYADMAKCSERPKWNRRKQTTTPPGGDEVVVEAAVVVETKANGKVENSSKDTDTDLSSLQNWPEIRNHRAQNIGKAVESGFVATTQDWPPKTHKSVAVNSAPTKTVAAAPIRKEQHVDELASGETEAAETCTAAVAIECTETTSDSAQQMLQQVVDQHSVPQPLLYQMPANIRDVQSIEQMQMRSLHHVDVDCSSSSSSGARDKHHHQQRPAVVILSNRNEKHVVDITFGFDVNEQLLSCDGDVCGDFINRFYLPDVPLDAGAHIDKLVNYIGGEWQDIVVQTQSGRAKYYNDDVLSSSSSSSSS